MRHDIHHHSYQHSFTQPKETRNTNFGESRLIRPSTDSHVPPPRRCLLRPRLNLRSEPSRTANGKPLNAVAARYKYVLLPVSVLIRGRQRFPSWRVGRSLCSPLVTNCRMRPVGSPVSITRLSRHNEWYVFRSLTDIQPRSRTASLM